MLKFAGASGFSRSLPGKMQFYFPRHELWQRAAAGRLAPMARPRSMPRADGLNALLLRAQGTEPPTGSRPCGHDH